MIKAVIFDVGGVLVNEISPYIQADIKKTLGIEDAEFEKHYPAAIKDFVTGRTDEAGFWKNFLSLVKAKNPEADTSELFTRAYKQRRKINRAVLSLALRLKDEGYKIAILSDTITPHIKLNTELGVYVRFPLLVLSNKVGMIKPDKKMYELTLRKLGVKRDEAVFIDDKQYIVDGASKSGYKMILFKNAKQLERDLKIQLAES